MMKIIAVCNQKGGIGKTTSCVQLAQALSRKRRKVLLMDADPQANTTLLLTGTRKHVRGLGEVLRGEVPLQDVVQLLPSGVSLCASTRLEGIDRVLEGQPALLGAALEAAPLEAYDPVIIDCPPQLGMLTVNALVAAEAVLVPVLPAFLALDAVKQLAGTIKRAQGRNPGLVVLGYLLVQVHQGEKVSAESREQLRGYGGPLLWKTEIPVDTRLKMDPASTRHSRGVKAYELAARELGRRLKQLDQEQP
jgi:chromosome partitioning protein